MTDDLMALLETRPVPTLDPEVVLRTYGTDAVAWSPRREEPIWLDPVATILVQCFDGEGTIANLVDDVAAEVGVDRDTAVRETRRVYDVAVARGLVIESSDVAPVWPSNPVFFDPPDY